MSGSLMEGIVMSVEGGMIVWGMMEGGGSEEGSTGMPQ